MAENTNIIAFSRFSFVSIHQTATEFHLFILFMIFAVAPALLHVLWTSAQCSRMHRLCQFFVHRTICNCQSFHPSVMRRMKAGRLVEKKNCIGITLFEPNLFRLAFCLCYCFASSLVRHCKCVWIFINACEIGVYDICHAYINWTLIYIKLALMK